MALHIKTKGAIASIHYYMFFQIYLKIYVSRYVLVYAYTQLNPCLIYNILSDH
jgi:hypothetical protein